MKKYSNYLIASGILSAVLLYLFFKRKMGTYRKSIANEYETIKQTVYTIIKPKNTDDTFDVIYVFGGLYYATPEWMIQQIPEEIKLRNIIISSSYSNSLNATQRALKEYMDKNNLKINSESTIGFSKGGVNVLDGYSKDFKFVGLIDPSNNSTYNKKEYDKNTYMIYNKYNWDSYPTIQNNFDKLSNKINSDGGTSESTTLSHKYIPKYFFEKFKNLL